MAADNTSPEININPFVPCFILPRIVLIEYMITPDLNPMQTEATRIKKGPLLIVAGAGSGKTKTLTSLLASLLGAGVKPDTVIAITFTNKAADEMKKRVNKVIGQKSLVKNPFIGTFHSLGVRILKEEAKKTGRKPTFSIYDSDDSLRLLKLVLKKLNMPSDTYKPAMVARKISRIKNELMERGDIEDKRFLKIFDAYEQALQEGNSFDFDDLIEKVVRIFYENPAILKKYQKKFQYILVDEYQDINTSQYWFIKLLADEHKNIFVVGDDAQSIYRFRGSDFRNFLNFERDWPNAKVVFLEQNYRSTKNIIGAASALIKNNAMQKFKELWTENHEGEPITIFEAENEDEEANRIVDEVQSSISSGKEVAILYRTNAQSRAIEQALLERNISYEIFGGIRFHARKEVKDILAGLRYALNPQDTISKERLEKTFYKKIATSLIEELPSMGLQLSVVELIGFFLQHTNYLSYLASNYRNAEERTENVEEVIKLASEIDTLGLKPPTGLQIFLEKMSLLQGNDKSSGGIGGQAQLVSRVKLMTIHLSKGLEFETVCVIGCGEGILPHRMSIGSSDEVEEERRLMYVAMTRAKKKLYISFYDIPSRFLYELPPELVEFKGTRPLDDEERYIEIE